MKSIIKGLVWCEKKLHPLFLRLPKLPTKNTRAIVKYLPYIVLLIGLIGIFQGATTFLFKIARLIFTSPDLLTRDIFVSVIANFTIGGLLVGSFLPLYRLKLIGWHLVFGVTLLTGILNIIGNPLGVLQSMIFLYVLFQVRESYTT